MDIYEYLIKYIEKVRLWVRSWPQKKVFEPWLVICGPFVSPFLSPLVQFRIKPKIIKGFYLDIYYNTLLFTILFTIFCWCLFCLKCLNCTNQLDKIKCRLTSSPFVSIWFVMYSTYFFQRVCKSIGFFVTLV